MEVGAELVKKGTVISSAEGLPVFREEEEEKHRRVARPRMTFLGSVGIGDL